MTRITKVIFLIFMILLFSCEDNGIIIDCKECTASEPQDAIVRAEIDVNYTPGTIVMLWEGKLEDKLLLDSVKIFTATYERKVSINKTYTITATYTINNKQYTAVDSATPRVRYTTDYCEEPCYYLYDLTYDLRLKYTK
jgi:hypothetical protein